MTEIKKGPYHIDDIIRIMLDMFPNMQVDEDLDGQLIIYTDFECCSSDGFYCQRSQEDSHI